MDCVLALSGLCRPIKSAVFLHPGLPQAWPPLRSLQGTAQAQGPVLSVGIVTQGG